MTDNDNYREYNVYFTCNGKNYRKPFQDLKRAEQFYKTAKDRSEYSCVRKDF